jgi:propionate catabolism operon transcriptional regulator
MQRLIAQAKIISDYEGAVLIYGENGTGKELFAQSIHHASKRCGGPFVAVNCAALTESLLESELFGYVGGAFTGARKEGKAGLFELAHKGTIFLDEINSMPISLQSKLLRVLEQQEVMRVGSDYVIPLNVRVIAASNTDLDEPIRNGTFRRDLFFRLNTFRIDIPPMHQRQGDVLLLFKHYLAEYEHTTPDALSLAPDFVEELQRHPWYGNVREIKAAALRYHAFGGDNSSGVILETKTEESGLVTDDLKVDLHQLNHVIEELVINGLLEKGLSKTEIANALGISRQALYKKINKAD